MSPEIDGNFKTTRLFKSKGTYFKLLLSKLNRNFRAAQAKITGMMKRISRVVYKMYMKFDEIIKFLTFMGKVKNQ
jgi:hypothetical protein